LCAVGGEEFLFFRDVKEIAYERSWDWVNGWYLTNSTEGYEFTVQDQNLRTMSVRPKIGGEEVDQKCRVCLMFDKTGMYLESGRGELTKKQYLMRHNRMRK
jgi:hypothetical protein